MHWRLSWRPNLKNHCRPDIEQLNYMLGYDAAKGLFIPPMTATTILPSGQIFAFLIMDTVIDLIRPELEKRQQRMESTMDKYLSKYGSD